MNSPVVVYALNIKGKGALQVLRSFINAACIDELNLELHISKTGYDALGLEKYANLDYLIYKDNFYIRIYYQIFFGILHFRSEIFVFGDIPILFKEHFLLIQNRLYFDLRFRSLKTQLGRAYFRVAMRWVKVVFVQTEAMKFLVDRTYSNKIVVCSHPSGRKYLEHNETSASSNIVLALTSPYKHKNNALLKKVRLESNIGLYVTLDDDRRQVGADITFIGSVDEETLSKFYAENPIVLVTSYVESYSLPLVEASELGLRFVCPDEDYSGKFQSPNKFVYEQDNVESLNSAISKAINHTPVRQKTYYTWKKILDCLCHE